MPDKTSIIREQKRFTILLGNGKTLQYSTRKDFNYALAEVNRKLNVVMFELNEMWIFAFAEYRHIWFYLPSSGLTTNDGSIQEYHNDITRAFRLLSERSTWVNGSVFSFKFLLQIIDALKGEYSIMADIRKKKKQYIEVHIIESKIMALERLRAELAGIDVNPVYSKKVINRASPA